MANPLGVDLVLCLSLDLREDLWTELESGCSSRGWDYKNFLVGKPERGLFPEQLYDLIDNDDLPPIYANSTQYQTWHARPNAYRAFKAHQAMMRYCLDNGFQSALFIEDDSFITDKIDFSKLLVNDWDMFYLGSFAKFDSSKTIFKLDGNTGGGFHGVCLKNHIMQKLVKATPIGPMDFIAQKYLHDCFECLAIYPHAIRQRGGFSYVEGHHLGHLGEID